MNNHDNASVVNTETLCEPSTAGAGMLWGAVGVVAFSLTLPATKLAISSIDGVVVGLGRASIAALLAAGLLLISKPTAPRFGQWIRLGIVAAGVVVGFPLLTSFALRTVPSSHGAIVVGLLPAATALMAVTRGGERPGAAFWFFAALGLCAITAFCAVDGLGQLHGADALLLAAVLLAALGYAEGALLARELGSWQVICWALVLSFPIISPIVAWRLSQTGWSPTVASMFALLYVSIVSMFLGFFAWYRGLARGGIARVGQLQLAQPVLTLLWGSLFLGEPIGWRHALTATVVLGSVGLSLRIRMNPLRRRSSPGRTSELARWQWFWR